MQIYRQPARPYALADCRVALITGLSNRRCCCLHPQLQNFLQRLEVAEECKLYQNFPFAKCLKAAPVETSEPRDHCGEVPLWAACWANAQQYGRVFRSQNFLADAAPHWDGLRLATRKLLVVTGSCGLDLVRRLEFSLDLARRPFTLRVLALGPVAKPPAWEGVTVVQGSRDWITRMIYGQGEIVVPDVGHMDYWINANVQEIAQRWLADNISD